METRVMISNGENRADRRHQLAAVGWFLALAFGLSWGLWIPMVQSVGTLRSPLAVLAMAVGMWGPGASALVVTRWVLRESWRTTTLDRLGLRGYYLWAWFLPAAGTLASVLLTVGLGLARFDAQFSTIRRAIEAAHASVPIPVGVLVAVQVLVALAFGPLVNVLFAVGEEIGWRGFLLPRLMRAGFGQWPALVLSGAIWGVWHAPLIAYGHNYPDHPYWGILLMTGFTTLLGIVFGWLQLASGSVWCPAIAHGAINAVAGLPFVVLAPFDTAIGGSLASLTGWIPMIVFIAWLAWSGRLPVRLRDAVSPGQGWTPGGTPLVLGEER